MVHESYIIRDSNGVMLMRIAGKTVQDMFKQLPGKWRAYQERGGKRTVCFELNSDATWTQQSRDTGFIMYLWEGTKIIKE